MNSTLGQQSFLLLIIGYDRVYKVKLLDAFVLFLTVLTAVDMGVHVCHSAVYTCMFVYVIVCAQCECVCLRAGSFVACLPGLLSV